jgi:hypothetical protein
MRSKRSTLKFERFRVHVRKAREGLVSHFLYIEAKTANTRASIGVAQFDRPDFMCVMRDIRPETLPISFIVKIMLLYCDLPMKTRETSITRATSPVMYFFVRLC